MTTTTTGRPVDVTLGSGDDLREFLLVLRQALLMIVRWIEKHYVM